MRASDMIGAPMDKALEITTPEKIENFLNAFLNWTPLFRLRGTTWQFWISTIVEWELLSWENDSIYGLPSLQVNWYRLFIHEVEPISEEEFMEFMNEGWIKVKDWVFFPPMEFLEDIENTYGRKYTGLYYNWQETYKQQVTK